MLENKFNMGGVDMEDSGMVSIIMLSKKKAQYVEESVRSVMAQTYQNWERYRLRLCEADMKQLVGLPQQSNYYGERC